MIFSFIHFTESEDEYHRDLQDIFDSDLCYSAPDELKEYLTFAENKILTAEKIILEKLQKEPQTEKLNWKLLPIYMEQWMWFQLWEFLRYKINDLHIDENTKV